MVELRYCLPLVLVFACAGLANDSTGPGRNDGPNVLTYRLAAQPTYPIGRPVPINFSLKNETDKPLFVLKWYTPLEGIRGDIFTVTLEGKPLRYEGPMVKRGDPVRDDYVRIPPGGSVEAEVDLSQAYPFSKAGEYHVEFRGRLYDVQSDEARVPRPRDEHRGIQIQGNALSLRIEGK